MRRVSGFPLRVCACREYLGCLEQYVGKLKYVHIRRVLHGIACSRTGQWVSIASQCILGVSRAVSGFPLRVCACRERESAHRVRYGTYVKREVHAGVHSQGTQVQQ